MAYSFSLLHSVWSLWNHVKYVHGRAWNMAEFLPGAAPRVRTWVKWRGIYSRRNFSLYIVGAFFVVLCHLQCVAHFFASTQANKFFFCFGPDASSCPRRASGSGKMFVVRSCSRREKAHGTWACSCSGVGMALGPAGKASFVASDRHVQQPPMILEPMTIRLRSACPTSWAKEALCAGTRCSLLYFSTTLAMCLQCVYNTCMGLNVEISLWRRASLRCGFGRIFLVILSETLASPSTIDKHTWWSHIAESIAQ